MRRTRQLLPLGILACLVSLVAQGRAQDANITFGARPYGSFEGGQIDNVNLTTGNLSLRVPLVSFPQRGGDLRLRFTIGYDHKGFAATVVCPIDTCDYIWRDEDSGVQVFDDQFFTWEQAQLFCPLSSCPRGQSIIYYKVIEADQTEHDMVDLGAAGARSTDATGLYYNKNGVVIDRAGTRHFWNGIPSGSYIVKREDRNGNQILWNNSGHIDSVGRFIPNVAPTNDFTKCTGPLPIASASVWNLPGPSGGTVQYKLCVANVAILTNFQPPPGQIAVQVNSTGPMLQSIVLPNGTTWTFEYNSRDPGDPSNVNYGNLTRVTLPTGGTISYVWGPLGGCSSNTYERRRVLSRTVYANDGTGPRTWTYNWASSSPRVTVTDPLGNDTVHSLGGSGCQAYVTQSSSYQGSSSTGTLLKTVTIDYSSNSDPFAIYKSFTSLVNVVPIRITTTWANGQVSKVEKDHDSGFYDTYGDFYLYGNVIRQREYGYGSGSAGPLLRQTLTSYLVFTGPSAYLSGNLLDLASSVTVQDGGGVQRAYTSYGYDGNSLQPSGITAQHDTNPPDGIYRGNQTSVGRWLNTTGSTITSNVTYYDTGMMYQRSDPLAHATTYSYSATYDGAYPTQITDALGHSTTKSYDFNTGLLTGQTDPNNQTTTYAYDSTERLIQITFPPNPNGQRGEITRTFSETTVPFSWTTTTTIQATPALVNLVTTEVVDGLGRTIQTQLNSDPDGPTYTDMTYDADGRRYTVSNPHRSSPLPTDGITTYKYDALGRVTQVNSPDNSVVTTVYSGNSDTTTDQAGNQRRTFTDALGRLIEVDEPGPGSSNGAGAPGTGSVTVSGTEQSQQVCPQTSPTTNPKTAVPAGCVTVYDSGVVSVTVNGFTKSVSYGRTSTDGSIASGLASAFNADSTSPVSASSNGATVTVTSKTIGASTNYPLSATSSTNDPTDFLAPSFLAAPSGPNLTGGTDPMSPTPGTTPTLSLSTPVTTLYSYDTLDDPTSVVQDSSRQRSFTYDSLKRLTSAAIPEISDAQLNPCTITYTYSADDTLRSKVAPAPNQSSCSATVTTSYTYDPDHRLTQKSYSDASIATVQYGYDGLAPSLCSPTLPISNGLGRRTAMCDAAGSEAWSYDAMGGVLTQRRTTNGVVRDTLILHNLDESIASITYPSGRTITYVPGGADRPLNAVDAATGIGYAANAKYAPQGALSNLLLGQGSSFGGITLTEGYNDRLQLLSISAATSTAAVFSLNYNFNLGADNGSVKQVANNLNANRTQNFQYDALNRIQKAWTQATSGPYCWGQTFGYDVWGNLAWITVNQCQATQLGVSINNANHMSGFPYDAAGNLLGDGLFSYTWDAENHLKAIAGLTYTYDGDGRRVQKSSGKLYWYGLGDQVLDESDTGGNITSEYVFFGGGPIARIDSAGNAYYHLQDHLGTSRVIVNYAGSVCYDADFYPFGGELAYTDTCPPNYKFTGRERDIETGLDYFLARYYSSNYGRLPSVDPENASGFENPHDPQNWNGYAYARNNPLAFLDPSGRLTEVCDVTPGGQRANCVDIDEQQAAKLKKDLAAAGARFTKEGLILGSTGIVTGTFRYLGPDPERPLEYDNFVNFAGVGFLFKTAVAGGVGLLEGLFAGGTGTGAGGAAAGAATDAATGAAAGGTGGGLTPGTVFNAGRGLLQGEAELSSHAAAQAALRGVTKEEIAEALSHVPKQEAGLGSVLRFIGQAAEVRVNRVTGTIVTVIRFVGAGAPSPLP